MKSEEDEEKEEERNSLVAGLYHPTVEVKSE